MQVYPGLTDDDLRAILGVCDCLVGAAGRTTLAMALRGSRAQRVLRHKVDEARGYGHYAERPESDVLARIDGVIAEGLIMIDYRDGYPLLVYSDRGLELAKRYVAEEWLGLLRARVQPVAEGAALELPFLMSAMPNRNQNTVLLLAELTAAEADVTWLPLLRAWQAVETRRVRGRLEPLIAELKRTATER